MCRTRIIQSPDHPITDTHGTFYNIRLQNVGGDAEDPTSSAVSLLSGLSLPLGAVTAAVSQLLALPADWMCEGALSLVALATPEAEILWSLRSLTVTLMVVTVVTLAVLVLLAVCNDLEIYKVNF